LKILRGIVACVFARPVGVLAAAKAHCARARRTEKPSKSTLLKGFLGYNPTFTTKRAGIYRPFFLVDCFLMPGAQAPDIAD
jgi:hypothetical protein